MRKRLGIAVIAVIIAMPAGQANAEWNHPLPFKWYERLAQCETAGNLKHKTRSYVGPFGFARSTFDLFADTPNSQGHTLTFSQHARILDRAFWFGHTERGRKQYAVGPYGHGCFKHYWRTSSELRSLVCNNQKQSVRRWCRK